MYYVHKDYLGSYQAITDQNGTVWELRSYDPWGRARDPFTWGFDQAHFNKLFDRGFTGHEFLMRSPDMKLSMHTIIVFFGKNMNAVYSERVAYQFIIDILLFGGECDRALRYFWKSSFNTYLYDYPLSYSVPTYFNWW